MKENLKENIIHIIKVITGQDYRELKGEWEQQNITIDELRLERNKKEKTIEKLKKEKVENQEEYARTMLEIRKEKDNVQTELDLAKVKIKNLEKDLKDQKEKYEKEIEEKEKSRHSSASKNGAYVVRIKELEAQVEFLKKHRRSPSIDELKDYTLRRKSVCKKK